MGQGDIERKKPRAEQERELLGWLREFLSQFELAWKLLWDQRVSFFTKLVPLSLLGYLLMPFDLVPDALLGLGQVDDLVVILVGLRMFISLCPPEIVADLQGIEITSDDGGEGHQPVKEIIDLEPEMLPADREASSDPSA